MCLRYSERNDLPVDSFSGSSGHLHRNNLAPVYMQWAIRNRESSTRTAGLRVTGGSNLVFIDPASLRRTTATSAVANAQEPITMGTTASCLARAFGIVIRQIADLLVMMQDYKNLAPTLPRLMEITFQDALSLQVHSSPSPSFHLRVTGQKDRENVYNVCRE